MAITFTITAAGGNKIPQSDIATTKNASLSISSITDTTNVADSGDITKYDFDWYLIDNPSGTSSIDTSITADNESVVLNSIDTWGSYRIFVIARHKSTDTKSEENPLKAPEENFITLSVESLNNRLEKPANFERNWKQKYDKLVSVVEDSTKRINTLKVDNNPSGVSFTLPMSDGTNGQMLTTNGSGQLQFVDVDLSNMENNIALDTLTDVNVPAPVNGQVLKWNGSEWVPGDSAGITGLSSDDANDTLTIANGYSLLKESLAEGEVDPGLNHIGSLEEPFDELHIKSINGSLLIGETGRKLLPEILGASGEFLKFSGSGDFETVEISISDVDQLNDRLLDGISEDDPDDVITSNSSTRGKIIIAGGYDILPQFDNSISNHDNINLNSDYDSFSSLGSSTKQFKNVRSRFGYFSTLSSNFITAETKLSVRSNTIIEGDAATEITLEVEGAANQTADVLSISGFQVDPNVAPPRYLSVNNLGEVSIGDKTAAVPSHYSFPTSDGSAGQVLSTNGAGTLSFVDQASGGGSTDNISEGQAKVETVDTGSNGRIDFYTEVSSNTTTFPAPLTTPVPVWKISESGHIIPGKNATFDIGEAENKVRHLFLSDNSLYFGNQEETPTIATISRSNDDRIMGAYASSKLSISTTRGTDLPTNKTLLMATEPDPIEDNTQYAMTFSDGGPIPGWSLVPVDFTPAYLSLHLTQQTNSLETAKFRNPFNTHSSVGAVRASSVNSLNITGENNGRFTLANPGTYEVTIVLVVNEVNSSSSTSLKTFTVQIRKNTSFTTDGDPDINNASGSAITTLTTYARHGAVDPVERTVNFIVQTSSQNEYIDILMQGNTSFIALDAGTSISIKKIA